MRASWHILFSTDIVVDGMVVIVSIVVIDALIDRHRDCGYTRNQAKDDQAGPHGPSLRLAASPSTSI